MRAKLFPANFIQPVSYLLAEQFFSLISIDQKFLSIAYVKF